MKTPKPTIDKYEGFSLGFKKAIRSAHVKKIWKDLKKPEIKK
jgi:hypothetical protein